MTWLADRLVVGHSTRAAVLLRVVGALLMGGKLSLPTSWQTEFDRGKAGVFTISVAEAVGHLEGSLQN